MRRRKQNLGLELCFRNVLKESKERVIDMPKQKSLLLNTEFITLEGIGRGLALYGKSKKVGEFELSIRI